MCTFVKVVAVMEGVDESGGDGTVIHVVLSDGEVVEIQALLPQILRRTQRIGTMRAATRQPHAPSFMKRCYRVLSPKSQQSFFPSGTLAEVCLESLDLYVQLPAFEFGV